MVEIRNPNIEIRNKFKNQIFKCSRLFDLGLLTLKTLPYGAGYRLSAGKHTDILTHFQTKVNEKTTKKHFFWSS